nr:DUF4255 domain-containing protein [Polymorphobacter sp.]
MADFNAIAAVSRTLRRLLLDRITTPGVTVTLAPPDVTIAAINGARINLYLYEVSEHPLLKNQTIPGHENPGTFGMPPLSLVLRFLLTSHARSEDQQDSDIIAQAILGDAMLVLHDFGGRMDDLLLLTNRAGAIGDPVLDPVLQSEFERVKLMLHPIAFDELSKLWAAMPQANFRRSIAYEASVVQLEPRRPRRQAQPVLTRRLLATVARPPVITEAYRTPGPPPADTLRDGRIGVGDELTIIHPPTNADRLYVRLGNLEAIRIPLPSTGIIRLLIPDAQYPADLDHPLPRPIVSGDRLQPGALEVTLIGVTPSEGIQGGLDRGVPVQLDRALNSNIALMQLVPRITATTPAFGTAAATLRITGERLWSETLPSEVIIGDAAIPIRPPIAGEVFATPTPTQVEIPVSAIAAILLPSATPYPLAVQVNGARSRETTFTFRLDP